MTEHNQPKPPINNDEEQSVPGVEIDELDISNMEGEEIDLEHCRIKCINKLERFPNVRRLCLRNNLLKKLENFEPVCQTLEELDLYDNQITKEHLEDVNKSICIEIYNIYLTEKTNGNVSDPWHPVNN
ncbi:unnamed protein product [Trichobilharzia regenti]|nr:unnamed protein product [Trichobilharzia regenti]